MGVSKGVKPATRNTERVKNGHKLLSHNVFSNEWIPAGVEEEKTLAVAKIVVNDRRKNFRDRERGLAAHALRGLDFAAPHRTADVDDAIGKVEVLGLKPENFAGA